MIGYVIVILLMIVCSAFFSGTEISFNASNKLRLKKSAEEGSRSASLAYKISENFTEALSAILIGNNLANIAASTAATLIMTRILQDSKLDNAVKDTIITVVSTVVMTLIILIFGEITPKVIAKQHADKLVGIVAYPTRVIWFILFPIVKLVMLIVNLLRKLWGRDSDGEPTVTEDELSALIETVEEEGVINEDKSEMLQSAIEFHDTAIAEIMTPRTSLVAIDISDGFEEAKKIAQSSIFSRIPVYEDSIDNIIGILSLNRYYKEAVDNEGEFDIREILIKPLFLHKSMKLPAALETMRKKQSHIAIVTDEFGGTMGVITLEDVLEEIVGEIWDESDVIVDEIKKVGDDTYDVNGDMNIYDMFDELDVDDRDFESDCFTVGGWSAEMLEAEPEVGATFTYDRIEVTVLDTDGVIVNKVRVKVLPPPDDDE